MPVAVKNGTDRIIRIKLIRFSLFGVAHALVILPPLASKLIPCLHSLNSLFASFAAPALTCLVHGYSYSLLLRFASGNLSFDVA